MSDWGSDSEKDQDEEQGEDTANFVIIAIDCHESIFEKNGDQTTFKTALHSCHEVFDAQLMKGGKRGFCPIAVATVSDDSEEMTICDFQQNLPESLKKLRSLCEESDSNLEDKYKKNSPIQFSNFLLQCKSKLSALAPESRKYIVVITNNCNPVQDENDRRLCINQAKTFKDFKISIELLTFNAKFEYHVFFQEVLEATNSKFIHEYLTDKTDLLDKLLSLMTFRGTRAYFFAFLGKNTLFEIIEKRYIKTPKILNNVIVTKDTHKEVVQIKKGVTVKDTYELKFEDAEKPLNLTDAEYKLIYRDNIPVGYTLLGTYEGDIVELGLHSTDPKFIQRNNKKNSPHFDIFWQYCVDRNINLICARKYKADGPSKYVQLTPKLLNNVRSFLVLGIPFFNDIKYQEIHNAKLKNQNIDDEKEDEAIMKATNQFVKALNFEYKPSEIHDTVNCRKWEYVRSELLEEEAREVDNVEDLSVVNGNVTEIVENFNALIQITGEKRKAPPKPHTSRKK